MRTHTFFLKIGEEMMQKWSLRSVWVSFNWERNGENSYSHKKSREKIEQVLKNGFWKAKHTFFATETSRQSNPPKHSKSKLWKKFLSVFCDWKVYPRGSHELSRENLCVTLTTGPFTREQVAKIDTRAHDWVAKTGQHCFWNFSVFVKTKYFPKTPKTLKNLFVFESRKIEHVKTHFNKYNHTNKYGIHWI